jgi:hypothetical protein
MPLNKLQSVVKMVLPQKQFDYVYNIACNAWDVYQKVNDHAFYIPSYLYYKLSGNKEASQRIETVQKVLGRTMVSKLGVLATYDIVYQASKKVDGAFVECGVARGGCSAVMAMISRNEGKNRITWMFDSYEGLPPQTDKDGIQKPIRHKNKKANDLAEGYCLGTYEDVRRWFVKLELLSRIRMVKGWFQDTLPLWKEKIGDIAVLRLDGDWYESTKCCLGSLYPYVVKGGYIIIDDYQLIGCKKAVDEFMEKLAIKPKMSYDNNGRSYFRK